MSWCFGVASWCMRFDAGTHVLVVRDNAREEVRSCDDRLPVFLAACDVRSRSIYDAWAIVIRNSARSNL